MKIKPESDQFSNVPPVRAHSEPATTTSTGGSGFRNFLNGAVGLAGQLAAGAAGGSGFGAGPLGGVLSSVLGGGGSGALNGGIPGGLSNGTELTQLLDLQNKIQRESLVFNAQSNVLKVEYDTSMAAVRNIAK